ncbi:MAG: hypothetical protein HUU21_16265 [Polyangiaceae bacterium]|nr:hypothetical protein [Polyangiaceae bacterium]
MNIVERTCRGPCGRSLPASAFSVRPDICDACLSPPSNWARLPVDDAPSLEPYPATKGLEMVIHRLDQRFEEELASKERRIASLDRFAESGQRMLGPAPSPFWTTFVGAFVCAAYDTARVLAGEPEKCVGALREARSAPFGSLGAALEFAVYRAPALGIAPRGFVVAEDRDEDRIERSRALRRGVEFTPARQSRGGSTGNARSQGAVELRIDILRAVRAANLGPLDFAMLVQADVGVWRPRGAVVMQQVERDYALHRLELEFAGDDDEASLRRREKVGRWREKLARNDRRIPAEMTEPLLRHWELTREELDDAATGWAMGSRRVPLDLVRLKPAEIAERLQRALPGGEDLSAQAVGRRLARKREVLAWELEQRGLLPRRRSRAARAESTPPAADRRDDLAAMFSRLGAGL